MLTPGDTGSGARVSRAPTPSSGARPSRGPTPSGAPSSTHRDPTPSDAATADEQNTDVIKIEDDVPVGSKRKLKLKSDVWRDFDKISVANKWKAKRKWCSKLLSAEGRSGTSQTVRCEKDLFEVLNYSCVRVRQ